MFLQYAFVAFALVILLRRAIAIPSILKSVSELKRGLQGYAEECRALLGLIRAEKRSLVSLDRLPILRKAEHILYAVVGEIGMDGRHWKVTTLRVLVYVDIVVDLIGVFAMLLFAGVMLQTIGIDIDVLRIVIGGQVLISLAFSGLLHGAMERCETLLSPQDMRLMAARGLAHNLLPEELVNALMKTKNS